MKLKASKHQEESETGSDAGTADLVGKEAGTAEERYRGISD